MNGVTSRQLAAVFGISAIYPLFTLRGAGVFASAADMFVFYLAYCAPFAVFGLVVLSCKQRDMGMLNLPFAALMFVFAGLSARETFALWSYTEQGSASPVLYVLLMLALVGYALYSTAESFARLAPATAAAVAAALAILLIFSARDAQTENLQTPTYVLNNSTTHFFVQSAAAPLGFLALSSSASDREKLKPSYITFLSAAFIAAVCAVFVSEGVMGDYAQKASYPLYSLSSATLFKGSDALFAFVWIVCGLVRIIGLAFAGHALVHKALPRFSERKTNIFALGFVAVATVLGVFV